jgi:hypothetical protein
MLQFGNNKQYISKLILFKYIQKYFLLKILSIIVLLFSCSNYTLSDKGLTFSDSAYKPVTVPDYWSNYGACYLSDELSIEVWSVGSNPFTKNKIIFDKKIQILTDDGVEKGTIKIPVINEAPDQFVLSIRNASGESLPIDTSGIKNEYLKRGIIVFPNVTAGCVLAVHVEYLTSNPILFFEHTISQTVPVLSSKFKFRSANVFTYDFKTYNCDVSPIIDMKSDCKSREYIFQNVMPQPYLNYQAYSEISEKRVSFALRSVQAIDVISTWSKLASNYKELYFNSSVDLPDAAYTLINSIKNIHKSVTREADSLLSWTQNNIVLEELSFEDKDPEAVFETGAGNITQITSFLEKLYKAAGYKTDIIITRPRGQGGFDEQFVTPTTLVFPLVVISIGTKDYVVFPFKKGSGTGEYPEAFQGLNGLSLCKQTTVPLPASVSAESGSSHKFIVDCSDSIPSEKIVINLTSGAAFDMRISLLELERKKKIELLQMYLSELGTSNALEDCSFDGLEKSGGQLSINAVFSNPNQFVNKDNVLYVKLSNFFRKYYQSYDTLRMIDFVNTFPVNDTEIVEIRSAGKKIDYSFICHECENALFSVKCSQKVSGDTTIFGRIIKSNKITLNKNEMLKIYPDIIQNNRIIESGFTLHNNLRTTEKSSRQKK